MGGMEYYVANEKLDLKRGKTHRVKEGREIQYVAAKRDEDNYL